MIKSDFFHTVLVPVDKVEGAGVLADMFLSELRSTYSLTSFWDKKAQEQIYSIQTSSTLLVMYFNAIKIGRHEEVFALLNEISIEAER